ncbi:MAG TPA: Rieske 2Fe-2S domain-containing protein [Solirubrobacteraceae bacterium]
MATPPQTIASVVDQIASADQLDQLTAPLAKLVARATKQDTVKNALSGTWLGHQLHPLLTDVTIGAWVSVPVIDLVGGSRGADAARLLTGFGVLSAVPTAASGLSDWSETYGSEMRIGLVHAVGNVAALALQIASYAARSRGRRARGAILSLAGLGVASAAGYLGGHLVFTQGVGVSHAAFEHATSDWTDVAGAEVLQASTPLRVDAAGTPVVVVKTDEGLFALSATCVHAGGPLDEGEIVDGCLRCPWHQSMFRLDDGRAVRGPATVAQPVWQARIEDGRLQVRAGS